MLVHHLETRTIAEATKIKERLNNVEIQTRKGLRLMMKEDKRKPKNSAKTAQNI